MTPGKPASDPNGREERERNAAQRRDGGNRDGGMEGKMRKSRKKRRGGKKGRVRQKKIHKIEHV